MPREALRHLGEPAPRFREHCQQREVAEKVDALQYRRREGADGASRSLRRISSNAIWIRRAWR